MSRPTPSPITEPSRSYSTTNASAYESPSAPSTLSPQSPNGPLPGMALLGPQIINRSEPPNRLHFPPPVHLTPAMPDGQGRYGPSEYDRLMHQDQYQMNRMMAAAPGIPGDPIQGHKRAYRQRRKDPSCDACRERKVKCDATDTSSCSECSSRSVKCQFTKETNRRMSSIKQVQDLEKQLLAARQEVSKLQSLVKPDGVAVEDDDEMVPVQDRPKKRRRLESTYDASAVRRNMLLHGRGIFRAPSNVRPRSNPRSPPITTPVLPPRALGEKLVEDYKSWLHQKFPFVDLNLLSQQFDQAYQDERLHVRHDESVAVMFGVFACGALLNHVEEGPRYFGSLKLLIDFWEAAPTLQLIRAMILACIYMIETNHTSTAFNMMGHAVRAAQDIGLHHMARGKSTDEGMLKRNLWLSLFCLERTLAYELGRPSMIGDEDFVPSFEAEMGPGTGPAMSRMERIVSVVKVASHLRRAFKTPEISPILAQTVDADIHRCMSTLPPRFQFTSNDRLAPGETHAILYLQDIRLILHRHNLNPACTMEARRSGIDECLKVARNTARTLSRVVVLYPQANGSMSTQSSPSSKSERWEEDMRLSSSTFMCLHVWRCMLFLTACEDYEGALLCAIASKAIGKIRPVNSAAGRYYEFFLNFCIDRRRQKSLPLEEDEELIAYLSADLQGNLDQAWIWRDSADDVTANIADAEETFSDGEEEGVWDRWGRVIEELRRLLDEQKPRPELLKQASNSSTGSSIPAPKPDPASFPAQQLSPANRMSIADLI